MPATERKCLLLRLIPRSHKGWIRMQDVQEMTFMLTLAQLSSFAGNKTFSFYTSAYYKFDHEHDPITDYFEVTLKNPHYFQALVLFKFFGTWGIRPRDEIIQVPPPRDWTNIHNEIGGDMRWNDDMEQIVQDRCLSGDVQPFYGTSSYTGEALFWLQVGGNDSIFWNALGDSMYRVNGNLTLEKIVAGLDKEGFNAFDLVEL
ncbi:hypothetical protein FVEG_16837 [Fusarium verticillioides 7600]|uniref:Uncharacterized protein n=1 Tax=Gibberella moniliformis (strain M3125 / FGSC 7600) TaxID=334819 RepID=W7N4Y1_GIBM7|nr:hypothetical protein FVEG_16837 [Fusarium verticillioides 7600]EWG51697.1 hypothetical protein FVEG_16837 [Fusarium verticillioides 7600]